MADLYVRLHVTSVVGRLLLVILDAEYPHTVWGWVVMTWHFGSCVVSGLNGCGLMSNTDKWVLF